MPSWYRLVKQYLFFLAVQSTVSEIRHKRSRYQIVKDQVPGQANHCCSARMRNHRRLPSGVNRIRRKKPKMFFRAHQTTPESRRNTPKGGEKGPESHVNRGKGRSFLPEKSFGILTAHALFPADSGQKRPLAALANPLPTPGSQPARLSGLPPTATASQQTEMTQRVPQRRFPRRIQRRHRQS